MTGDLDVLVVIVNYRSAAHTARALRSLANERRAPGLRLSVRVVENDSGDAQALRELVDREYRGFVTLVESERNGGFGAGNNLGVRDALARGESPAFVHFLNPDTEVRPGAVLALARFLESHPRAGIVGSRFEHADGTPWRVAFRFPTPLGELEGGCCLGVVSKVLGRYAIPIHLGDEAAQVDWLSGASIMVRTSLLRTIGGFDESFFLYFEETDFCRRAKLAGWECWYVPESRVMHVRGQSTGVTDESGPPRPLPRYWFESRRRYFRKNHGDAVAIAADVAFLVGNAIGIAKHKLEGQPTTPNLLADFARESVILRRHREPLAPDRSSLQRT